MKQAFYIVFITIVIVLLCIFDQLLTEVNAFYIPFIKHISINFFIASVAYLLTIRKSSFDFFHPIHIFSFFVFCIFYISPIWLISVGHGEEFGRTVYSGCKEATSYATIGILCYYIGYAITNVPKTLCYTEVESVNNKVLTKAKIWLLLLIPINIAILLSRGMSLFYIFSMGQGSYEVSMGLADQYLFLINISYLMIVPWLIYCHYENSIWKRILVSYIIFVIFNMYGWRFITYIMAISWAIMYFRTKNRTLNFKYVVVMFVALLSYSVVMGEIRSYIRNGEVFSNSEEGDDPLTNTLETNFNIYNAFYALVDECPKKVDHTYGEASIVTPITMWIPRTIWAEKNNNKSVAVLVKILGAHAVSRGLAFPVFYEYYLDFGLIGIIFFSFLLGKYSKKSIAYYNSNSLFKILFFAILCGFWIQYINRSYMGMLCTLFGFLFAPMLYFKKYIK